MTLKELCREKLPDEFYEVWKKQGIESALPIQIAAVEAGLFSGRSLLVVAPTSSGKTFLGEVLAFHKSAIGERAIYLVPFKAIAEERHAEFITRYRDNANLGFRCIVSDRDHHEGDSDLLNGKYDVAILTYEKLAALLVANPNLLRSCSSVIIDEIQMISDANRGPGLELLLTTIRRLCPPCQILALSAVLGKINNFDKWLGAVLIKQEKRPVELRTGIVDPNGIFSYKENNTGKPGSENYRSSDVIDVCRSLTAQNEQVLVFVNSVRRTYELSKSLADSLKLPAAPTAMKALADEADTETREKLLQVLRNGVGFHNADCELPERLIIENAFRNREIRVLISTTTLSMGVNLPADNVILADNEKWTKEGGQFLTLPWRAAEVKNMLGRAGRLGKSSSFGRGLLLASNRSELIKYTKRYLESDFEPLSSALADSNIDERVLAVIASGYASDANSIEEFLFDTFAAAAWDSIRPKIRQLITVGIKQCIALELVEVDNQNQLKPTRLGSVCAANHLSLGTFKILKEYVWSTNTFDALDASFAAAQAQEVKDAIQRIKWDDPNRTISVRKMLNEHYVANKLVGYIQQVFGFMMEKPSDKHDTEFTIASVCKEVLDSERHMRELCNGFRISGANLRQICESIAWIVDVMSAIATVIKPTLKVQFQELSQCLLQRSPYSCRLLSDLPSYVSRDERIKLRLKGITETEQFLDQPPSYFSGIMSPSKAERIIRRMNENRERSHGYWQRDHVRRLDSIGFKSEILRNIYTTSGKELERSISELVNTKFAGLIAQPIPEQRTGEPDLLLITQSGLRIAVQITAKESNTKFVDSKKAGDVISQSARYKPDGYICLGRPDFEALAKEQAGHLANVHNYKQIPIYVLAELFVRTKEQRVTIKEAEEFIVNTKGYVTFANLPGSIEARA